jgi:DNA-binding MarR family transcriptional regulator
MSQGDTGTGLGPDLDILRELWALDRALQRGSKRMEKTLGVNGPERLALRLIDHYPGLTAGRLARLLHLHPSTVTGLLRRLTDRGLVSRTSDGPQRRRAQYRITDDGLELLSRPMPTIESAVMRTLQGLSTQRVGVALRLLASLAVGLELPDGPPWP